MIDIVELAKIMYTAYGDKADWKAFGGTPMPQWDALPANIVERWEASATAAIDALTLDLKKATLAETERLRALVNELLPADHAGWYPGAPDGCAALAATPGPCNCVLGRAQAG
jgi:hypothetical protein